MTDKKSFHMTPEDFRREGRAVVDRIRVAALLFAATILAPGALWQQPTEPLVDAISQIGRDPTEIVRGLLSNDINERIKALSEIGVSENLRQKPPGPQYEDFTKVDDVRLTWARLDEDPLLEAIITFNQGPYDHAAVYRRAGRKWRRVALLECWCKYERDPLAQFLELRRLVEPKYETLIVRESSGGTGVYWRNALFYRMSDGVLQEILQIPEERRNCNAVAADGSEAYCEATRSTIFYPQWTPRQQTIVVTTSKGREPMPSPLENFYPPPAYNLTRSTSIACQAYIWNQSKFRFIEDAKSTSIYCLSTKSR
ncbi:MAG TPA: hypothetical protein VGV68_02570 [Terriglobia bacterium]|nr:hypothetical protein [Terriglobia bacterium]